MVEAAGLVVDTTGSAAGRSAPSGSRPMFDYNVAPFFQSFLEIKVEPSANRVRVIPYGVNGRLTWSDFGFSERVRGDGVTDRSLVEWVVPMTPPPAGR